MRIGARFAVLRLRDLRYVFGASLVSQFGDGLVTVALAFAVLDLTGSASDLGVVIAARTVAQVAALLFGGVVADRTSRRAVMMGSDIVRFGGQIAVGVLIVSHHATVPEIAVSQAFLGAASGFFTPASSGLLPAVAEDHLQEANALLGIAGAGSGIIGPAVGAVLVVAVGPAWALVADGGTYLASALLLAQVRGAGAILAAKDGDGSSFLNDLHDGFKEVRSRTWVWSLILSFGFGNALAGTFQVLGPLICKTHYGGAPAYALLSALWAVGALMGGGLLLRYKPKRPLLSGVLLCLPLCLPGVLVALHVPLYVVVPFQLAAGVGPIAFNTLWWTTLQQHVPPEAISRVISYDYAGSYALQPLGYLLAGPLAVAIGLSPAMIICALGATVLTQMSLLVPDVWKLRHVSDFRKAS